jgi:hypothetical protein
MRHTISIYFNGAALLKGGPPSLRGNDEQAILLAACTSAANAAWRVTGNGTVGDVGVTTSRNVDSTPSKCVHSPWGKQRDLPTGRWIWVANMRISATDKSYALVGIKGDALVKDTPSNSYSSFAGWTRLGTGWYLLQVITGRRCSQTGFESLTWNDQNFRHSVVARILWGIAGNSRYQKFDRQRHGQRQRRLRRQIGNDR